MNDSIYSLRQYISEIPTGFFVIISHQITNNKKYDDIVSRDNIEVIRRYESGLSRSRNVLLDTAIKNNVDYLIISDDDVRYDSEGLNNLFKELINCGCHYQLQSKCPDGRLRKKYKKKSYKLGRKNIFGVSSIELCLDISSINKDGLFFDEQFGLGAKYPAGEEPIFLSDALDKGHEIKFLPLTVTIHPEVSSGLLLFSDERMIHARGAIFRRCFGFFKGACVALLFWLKKFVFRRRKSMDINANDVSKGKAFMIMFKGFMHHDI